MEQRDILLDEIEQFGRVWGKIFATFLDLKATGDITLAVQTTNQQLQSELDIDISELINFTEKELESYAIEKQFTDNQLDELTKYIYESGEIQRGKSNPQEALKYFSAAKKLLAAADKISQTYSFGRAAFKQKIDEALHSPSN